MIIFYRSLYFPAPIFPKKTLWGALPLFVYDNQFFLKS